VSVQWWDRDWYTEDVREQATGTLAIRSKTEAYMNKSAHHGAIAVFVFEHCRHCVKREVGYMISQQLLWRTPRKLGVRDLQPANWGRVFSYHDANDLSAGRPFLGARLS
jgi:hypothetical protein